MPMSASLLDIRFLGALCLVILFRLIWPKRFYSVLGAISSAILIGLAAPKTLIAICSLTLFLVVPLRLLSLVVQRRWPSKKAANFAFLASIGALVAVLVIFKAYRQFSVPWLGGRWLGEFIPALIGFSYFVFRAIDY